MRQTNLAKRLWTWAAVAAIGVGTTAAAASAQSKLLDRPQQGHTQKSSGKVSHAAKPAAATQHRTVAHSPVKGKAAVKSPAVKKVQSHPSKSHHVTKPSAMKKVESKKTTPVAKGRLAKRHA